MYKKWFQLAGIMALTVSLCACGNNENNIAQTTDNQVKHMNIGATTGFFGAESLDPANSWDGWIMSVYGIGENLFRLDDQLQPQPWLVESYEMIDNVTWQLKIRDDVQFSNGHPVTAEAVKACFERTFEKNVRAASTLKIKEISAEGQILTLVTKEENPTFLNDLCDPLFVVYDAQSEIDEYLGASCTGPYVATDFQAMTEVKLEKHEAYWGGEPAIDTIDLKIIDDADALTMAMQNGELDMVARMSPSSAALFENSDEYVIDEATSTRSEFIQFNMASEKMQDERIRQAISLCIDREGYADVIYAGYAAPLYGVYPESLSYGGTEGLQLSVTQQDVEKAAELVKACGYSKENPLALRMITYSYNSGLLQLADMLAPELSEIGISLTIDTFDVLEPELEKGDYDFAALCYAMAPTGNSQYLIDMLFVTDGSGNTGKYSNTALDEKATELSTTFDQDQRDQITKEICQMVLDDEAYTFIASQQLLVTKHQYVKGFEINPSEYYLLTNEIDIEK